MDHFAAACDNFGSIINTEKTVVMHQPSPDAIYVAHRISVNGPQLQVVDNFTYLGSALSHTTKIGDEVARRIDKASQIFGRLQNTVWNPHDSHPADAAVWSGDLDGVPETSAKSQSFPPRLSSTDTEGEMAGRVLGHGCAGADGDPQYLRYAVTTTTALERSPRDGGRREATQSTLLRRCRYGFPTTRKSCPA
ncbi:hypothetical protein SprV_0301236300 [Sparganum proliferum]